MLASITQTNTDEQRQSRPKVETSDRPWIRVITLLDGNITFDDAEFRTECGLVVPWSSVVRVALGYEIHWIAIADWDFWAFQTIQPDRTYWVYTDLWASAFSKEVRRRFRVQDIPPMNEWMDRDFCIRAYVVWPSEDVGLSLYITVKRHWWSWRQCLAYPNQ